MKPTSTPISKYLEAKQSMRYWRQKMRLEKDPKEKAQYKREFRKARNKVNGLREMV